jgi:hypothetical protein
MEIEFTTYSRHFRAFGLVFQRGIECSTCGRWGASVSFYKWSLTIFPFGRGDAQGCSWRKS